VPHHVRADEPKLDDHVVESNIEVLDQMRTYGKAMALATAVLSLPLIVAAQGSPATNTPGQREADQLVTVNAVLSHTIDAKQDHPGASIEAKLNHGARLADGTNLPSGSTMVGKVVQDDTQPGTSKLALRFDQARLKDGKVIPIRATIVGVANGDSAVNSAPTWQSGTLQVDQLGVIPGVDLHSKIAGENSGVFVSTKNDLRLNGGSQIEFVVAPRAQTMAGL
jgi:hypothetical protein